MFEKSTRSLSVDGLWKNNPALVQLLGLCPLLAVSNSVANALGLAIATIFVVLASNTIISSVRNLVPESVRLPVFVLVIASAVSCTQLLIQAYAYELHLILGIFLPLITTNCLILGRAESFARKNPVGKAAVDGLASGLGFAAVLVVLGALRELLGTGHLFANMELLFGPEAAAWEINVFSPESGLLVAILPPGAFLFAGLLIALKNALEAQMDNRAAKQRPTSMAGSKRVRITGKVF